MNRPATRVQRKTPQTRILIVDDHPLVRERLADVINGETDLLVCGQAEDRFEALETIKAEAPDFLIVDITLKDSDGLELIKDVRVRWPRLRMLVVSMHDESLYAERVIRAGAQGYITKQEATRSILVAIRRVLSGNIYLNERISSQIISRLAAPSSPSPLPDAIPTPSDVLADREFQVFELTGRGFNTRQIAEKLHIGVKTVETYRMRIREKLHLNGSDLLQAAISWTHKER